MSFLGDTQLARLERLITTENSLESHRRIELVVSWHLNEFGLAWPSLKRIRRLLLVSNWPPGPDVPARGHTAPGVSLATIKRTLSSSSTYTTVGRLATERQQGGGWFVRGSIRALTDPARERISLDITLAHAVEWAAAAGVFAPLGELAPRRFQAR
jgi:hypothetical protein